MQFYRPQRNEDSAVSKLNIKKTVDVPKDVAELFQIACNDCHTNNTNYPWYANIQPVGLLLDSHIKEGKTALDFDDFGSYSIKKQYNKIKSIGQQIKDNTMPISSYTLMHEKANLTLGEKQKITDWAEMTYEKMKNAN